MIFLDKIDAAVFIRPIDTEHYEFYTDDSYKYMMITNEISEDGDLWPMVSRDNRNWKDSFGVYRNGKSLDLQEMMIKLNEIHNSEK